MAEVHKSEYPEIVKKNNLKWDKSKQVSHSAYLVESTSSLWVHLDQLSTKLLH